MKEKFEFYNGELSVEIDVTQEKKDEVFKAVLDYMKENDCTSAEHLHQSDNCIIDAPDVLGKIIDDIIKPETEWNE